MSEETKQVRGMFAKIVFIVTCVMIVLAALVNVILLVFVLPTFREVFASFGSNLPVLTKISLAVSEYAGRFPVPSVLAAALIVWVLVYFIGKIKSDKNLIIASALIGTVLVLLLLLLVVSMFLPIINMNMNL